MLKRVAGLTLSFDLFKTKLEGVIEALAEDNFTMSFKRWLQCCKMVVCIDYGYTDKSQKTFF
jgi:hypothetical protein